MGIKDLIPGGSDEKRGRRSTPPPTRSPTRAPSTGWSGRCSTSGSTAAGRSRPVRRVAEEARAKAGGDREKAIAALARRSMVGGGIGGFVTGFGGFVTMPVSLPVNVAEFYLQAVRMVGGIATLRGYDVDEPRVRTRRPAHPRRLRVRGGPQEGRDDVGVQRA